MQTSQTNSFEPFDASSYRVGIVCAKFNGDITEKIIKTTLEKLAEYKVPVENISTHYVAGSVELPVVLQWLAKSGKYDCLAAIGAIIRGETDHYDYVAKIVTEGVLRVMLDHTIPVGYAVLTTANKELAEARINIGAEAVEAVLQVVKLGVNKM